MNWVENSFEQASLLIDRGASIHAADSRGYTCLHFLLKRNHQEWGDAKDSLYLPQRYLTRILIKCLLAGADVYYRNHDGQSPTCQAQIGGREKAWREALRECGYDPEHVYQNSSATWIDLPDQSVMGRIYDIIPYLREPWSSGWSLDALHSFLQEAVASPHDETELTFMKRQASIHVAKLGPNAEHAWRVALKTCRWDPRAVYAVSEVPWRELTELTEPGEILERYFHEDFEFIIKEIMESGHKIYKYVDEDDQQIEEYDIKEDVSDTSSSGEETDELVSDENNATTTPNSEQCRNDIEVPVLLEPHLFSQPSDTSTQLNCPNEWEEYTSPSFPDWDHPRMTLQDSLVANFTTSFVEDMNVWDEE